MTGIVGFVVSDVFVMLSWHLTTELLTIVTARQLRFSVIPNQSVCLCLSLSSKSSTSPVLNDSADFDEICLGEPFLAVLACLRKLVTKPLLCLATGENLIKWGES